MYGFFNAQEFKNLADKFGVVQIRSEDQLFKKTGVDGYVNRFYTLVLDWTQDENGYNDWTTQLNLGTKAGGDIATQGYSKDQIIDGFIDSQEFINLAYSFGIKNRL